MTLLSLRVGSTNARCAEICNTVENALIVTLSNVMKLAKVENSSKVLIKWTKQRKSSIFCSDEYFADMVKLTVKSLF